MVLALAVLLVGSACGDDDSGSTTTAGSSATTTTAGGSQDTTSTTAAPTGDSGAALQAVYDELAGLEGEARLARLVELAAAETAPFTCYCVLNTDDMAPLTAKLDQLLGARARMDHYRANADTILQRLILEAEADFAGADVVMLDGPEVYAANEAGLFLPLDTPVKEGIFAATDTYAPFVLITYTAFWNTNAISDADAPVTWEDVLSNYGDQLLLESTDFAWFQSLVANYFMGTQGMTEEEAVDLFRSAAEAGAGATRGHTLMVQQVASGEFDIGASGFWFRIAREASGGQPLGYDSPQVVQPLVTDIAGMGIHRNTRAPATALLFIELTLNEEGQQALADLNFTPARRSIEALTAIPEGIEVVSVDLATLHENRAKWADIYDSIIQSTGG